VDFTWTVGRVRANLAAYYDIDVVALKVGSENLDDTNTLNDAGVTSSTQLLILTKADVASNSPEPRVDDASSTGGAGIDTTDTGGASDTQSTDSTDSTGGTDVSSR